MSAYIVSDDTAIVVAAWAAKPYGPGLPDKAEVERIANELIAENYASVNYRYNEKDKPHKVEIPEHAIYAAISKVPDAEIAGAIRNYDYQACEHDAYRASRAKMHVDCAMNNLVRKMFGDNMGWGIDSGALAEMGNDGSISLTKMMAR
jgi:hypothetical protein